MTDKELLHAIGEIDDSFIAEAAPGRSKKRFWIGWTAAAACLVLVLGLLALPILRGGQLDSRYKYPISRQETAALVLRWEDKTLSERYLTMTFGETAYRTRGMAIDAAKLGAELGSCEASGYDVYTDQTYRETFHVYAINGIDSAALLAVKMEERYYVFLQDAYTPPATLGEMVETYNLTENLPLTYFSYHEGRKTQHYQVESDDGIWALLMECADAPLVKDETFSHGERYISFTATSEALGIYRRVFYVTEDGYVKTNALDYGFVFRIGAEAAQRIIAWAIDHATETKVEPYNYFVAGRITEVGDGYLVVDDTVLCRNEADGVAYRVLTTDPTIARWLKYYDFQVGDLVYIEYRSKAETGNVITDAYAIKKAILGNGEVLVNE